MAGDGTQNGELNGRQPVTGAFVQEQGDSNLLAAPDQVARHLLDVIEIRHERLRTVCEDRKYPD